MVSSVYIPLLHLLQNSPPPTSNINHNEEFINDHVKSLYRLFLLLLG